MDQVLDSDQGSYHYAHLSYPYCFLAGRYRLDYHQADITTNEEPMHTTTLAVSSWSWHEDYYNGRWSLLDQPAGAVAVGLSAIECNDFMLPPPRLSRLRRPVLALLPGAPPELWRYSRATLQALRDAAAVQGVNILAWTINSDFTVLAYQWPAQQLYLRRGLQAARLLQVPLMRINLGGKAETPTERDQTVQRRLVAFVHQSQQYYPGLTLTVENHWGISSDIDRHLRIVDGVRAALPARLQAHFGCCFDPDNMPQGAERKRWWRELAQRANHYHLKTTTFHNGHSHLPHHQLFNLLAEVGYRGAVTIEYAGEGEALAGIRQSAELFAAGWRNGR